MSFWESKLMSQSATMEQGNIITKLSIHSFSLSVLGNILMTADNKDE
jgi:hypothetical protein